MRWTLIALIGVSLAACSSGVVTDAASKFHDGFTASTTALAAQKAELLAIQQSIALTDDIQQFAPWPQPKLSQKFAAYVCLAPYWPPDFDGAQNTLTQVAEPIDPAKLKADQDFLARLKGIYDAESQQLAIKNRDAPKPNETACPALVARYMELHGANLPLPSPRGKQVAAFLAAAGVLYSAAQAAAQGIYDLAGLAEQEAKADQLLSFVRSTATQQQVFAAFSQLYDVDPNSGAVEHTNISDFCNNTLNKLICDSIRPAPPADETNSNPNKNLCGLEPKQFVAPRGLTDFDGITVGQRWLKLQTAWDAFVDLSSRRTPSSSELADRIQALNTAVGNYLTVPATTNVAAGMITAWARLSDLAYGCLSPADALAELTAFASNADTILTDAQKTSDAIEKARSTLTSSSGSNQSGASPTNGKPK